MNYIFLQCRLVTKIMRVALFGLMVFLHALHAVACDRIAVVGDKTKGDGAWWLRIHFAPCDKSILGVPVETIQKGWVRASLLRKGNIPHAALFEDGIDQDELRQSKLEFELRGDFNSDGKPDRVVTGVFENSAGDRGLFVAIFTRSTSTGWRLAFLHTNDDGVGLLALRTFKGNIEVWSCMSCDDRQTIIWDAKNGKYVWVPSHEPE